MQKLLQEAQEDLEFLEKKKEESHRVLAVQHTTSHHFLEHAKGQGQQGEILQGSMFQCDRLWKSESEFSEISKTRGIFSSSLIPSFSLACFINFFACSTSVKSYPFTPE